MATARGKKPVPRQVLLEILNPLSSTKAVLVGGQAIWVWTEMLRGSSTALQRLGPVSSDDVDFFGYHRDAKALADAFDTSVRTPIPDDQTPNTAQVEIKSNGKSFVVDFIGHVFGIQNTNVLQSRAQVVDLGSGLPRIVVLHPIHCLFSRAANTLSAALNRKDEHSITQLKASFHIARRWIVANLETGNRKDLREAKKSLRELFEWARSNEYGRQLSAFSHDLSPIVILRAASDHAALDDKYREKTLGSMIAKLAHREDGVKRAKK